MRRFLPLAILLVALAACGRSERDLATSQPVPDPLPTKGITPPAFDPNSAENTLAWVTQTWKDVGKWPKDNDIAKKEAINKFGQAIQSQAKGQRVRWLMRLQSINDRGQCLLSRLEQSQTGTEPQMIYIDAYAHPNYTLAPYFSSSPPKADWLKKYGAGDRVAVVGTVAPTSGLLLSDYGRGVAGGFTIGFNFILEDGHVEQP